MGDVPITEDGGYSSAELTGLDVE